MKTIGISGTRQKKIPLWAESELIKVLKTAKNNNYTVNVGDCPTGIDPIVKAYCETHEINLNIFKVLGVRKKEKLRQRTIDIVEKADEIYTFPKDLNPISSGTWLATFEACRKNKKNFVCYKTDLIPLFNLQRDMPKIKEIESWLFTQSKFWIKPKYKFQPKQMELNLC